VKCLADMIDDQISIRREMLKTAPEPGSNLELDALLASVNQRSAAFSKAAPQHPLGAGILARLAPNLTRQREQAAARLRSQAGMKIDILRREVALNVQRR
jgi:hypothetical protein